MGPHRGLTGLLLRGGASRRMGRDKGEMRWRGQPLWERQVRLLRRVADPVWQAVAYGHAAGPDRLVDEVPFPGPLAPIGRALRAMDGPWLLVLAVDLPNVPAILLERLWQSRVRGGVVMAGAGSDVQPLCAVWHRDMKEAVDAAQRSGQRRVRAALDSRPLRVLRLSAPDDTWIANLNTPEDVLRHGGVRWLQVAGYSGLGKTTILADVTRRLVADGHAVTAWKVTHHPLFSPGGKDSGRLREAGAESAWVLADGGAWVEGALHLELVVRAVTTPWLLVEGGRMWPTPKVVLGQADWPAHAPPVTGSAGRGEPLAPLHVDAGLPEESARVADWIVQHRHGLSTSLEEVARWPLLR